LLGSQWTVGSKYTLSQANLDLNFPQYPALKQNLDSVLQTVNFHANWNNASGLFSVLEANWYHQHNSGFSPAEPGDDFWQLNAYAGYRFCHRKAEFSVGVLNLTDQNYRLEPLNLNNEMARSRTFLARLLISF
jgi:outer membrane receptor protein involved in Fe transport